jgi:hypothetical protein
MFRTSWVHPQGDSCICSWYYYIHRCEQSCTRVIQKISSVCEYCRCSAAVTMVRMRDEFVDSMARHGRNLQTFEQCLRIALCVYNV